MGFFAKKNEFWLQNQKLRGKFLQPRNSNRPSMNNSNLAESRHLGSLTAANWVSFDFNVSYSSWWGYSLINTFKLKTKNQETEAHTEGKRSRRICRYDRGLEFEASFEKRVHVNHSEKFAISIRAPFFKRCVFFFSGVSNGTYQL